MNYRITRVGMAFLCGAVGLASGSAQAASYRWVGANNSAWNNAANWLPQGVPSKGDSVVIDDRSRVSIASGATVANLRVGAGAEINNGGNLQVTGKTTSSGLFTGDGTLVVPSGATANFSVNASTMRGCALPSSGSNRGTSPVVFGSIINRGHMVTRVAKGCRVSFASIQNTGSLQVVSDGATKFQNIRNNRQLSMNVAGTLTLANVENRDGATLRIAATNPLTTLIGDKTDSVAVHLNTLTNRKGGQVVLSGASGRMFDGKSIVNEGKMQMSGAQTLLKENVTNAAGATLTLDSNASVSSSDASAPKFHNAGKLIKPAGSDATLSVEWNNTGQVVVENGTLHVRIPAGKACKQSAGVTTLEGGVLSVEDAAGTKSSGIYEVAGGTLGGIGTIEGNLVNSGGRVKPGHSPGTITINGNYVQTENGILEMELGGTTPGVTYDQILVNGTAYLDGCLQMVRWAGFCPAPGDVYVLLSYYARSGNFDTFVDAQPVAGITYDTTVLSTDFELNCYGQAPPTDTTAPTAAISAPLNNANVRTITGATGTASDAVGVSNVTCRLYRYNNPATGVAAAFWAGGTSWTSTATLANERPANGTNTWNFTFPSLAPGRYSLRATAKDATGNTGVSATNAFYVDPNAPSVVTIATPANGSTVSGLPSISGTASDASDGSGLSGVKCQLRRNSDGFSWNGSIWVGSTYTFGVSLSGVNWSRTSGLPTGASLPAGSYSLITTATDKATNTRSVTSTFNVAPSGGDAPPSNRLS